MYDTHCENLKSLERAIKVTQRHLREYISKQDESNTRTFTRLLLHLITCWAEVCILKVANEPNGFNRHERERILTAKTLEKRWQLALNIAIVKANNLSVHLKQNGIAAHLDTTTRQKYQTINKLIARDLLQSIQLRNRIAHGQWEHALTGDKMKISNDLTTQLRLENIMSLQTKMHIFKNLAYLIRDITVSPKAFIRDFNKYEKNIQQHRINLKKKTYDDYKAQMIEKLKRGSIKKLRLIQPSP